MTKENAYIVASGVGITNFLNRMNQDYQDKNQNTSANSDEDDEFGGAKLTLELFYRNRKKPVTVAIHALEVDEDDEFGSAKLTPELIYGSRYKKPSPQTVIDEDDEFGGGKLTPELIYGNRYKNPSVPNAIALDDSEQISESLYTCKYKIFSPYIPTNQWYVDREQLTDKIINPYQSITIPLVIDTEFTDKQGKKEYQQKSRLGLTTQMCSIASDSPKAIFAHTSQVNAGRMLAGEKLLPMIKSDFHPVDYLRTLGLEVETWEATESELAELPKCFIVLYGHFLTAEINMIANGTVKDRIKNLQRSQGEEQITSGRRAFCQTIRDGQKLDWVSLKHIITIERYHYELCLKSIDTGAIHGVAPYKDFCSAVGWKLQYKDNFTSDEKSKMLDMAIERFKDFENYALGDLEVYEALNAYYEQWKIVYEKLSLADYFQCPKLTIGGTVKDLFEAALAAKLGLPAIDADNAPIWREPFNEIVEQFIKPASANDLRQFSTHTRALLAKVEGGRCRNNRPTDIFVCRKIKGKYDAALICDIDISGCYGEGQRNQSYFFGIPEIFDYKATNNNDYISLREWLKSYEVNLENLIKAVADKDKLVWKNPDNWGELINGAWHARFKATELKYPQDFFASWFTESADRVDLLAKSIRNMKSDTELTSSDWVDFDEDTGNLKIFNHDIYNGVLTHDGLQWILAVCSPRQRNELLDNIKIMSSAVYPRSQKINGDEPKEALENLTRIYDIWEGRNTTERVKVNGRSKIVMNFDECHAWFDINLGDLLVNNLLIERKKAQKIYGKKSPLDVLFKLCVNTLYGDMVSKYFITSNPTVGNNITARARCLAWFMEKGLHGWQSITDGCAFELNKVLYALRDAINGEVVNQHREGSKLKEGKIKRAPMGGVKQILARWNDGKLILSLDGIEIEKPLDWIDTTAMSHLQKTFDLVDVLHNKSTSIKVDDDLNVTYTPRIGQFGFETKDVYWCGAFHGSANYILCNPNGSVIKTRGYETKREHTAIDGNLDEQDVITFFKSDRYGAKNNPAKDLMNQMLENPENIKRQLPAIKSGILKITDYKNLSSKYDKLGIEPGDTILRSFLLQEFSLSQFTFKTYEQYMMWKGIISHLKDTERQSLEGYFLNDDGTLNFVKLVNWVDEQIEADVDKPFDLLADPNRNSRRTEKNTQKPTKNGKGRGKKKKMETIAHPGLQTFNVLREQLKDVPESETVDD